MDQKFILKKGTRLRSISLEDDISYPTQALYFTTPGEALISLFREKEKKSELGLLQVLEVGESFFINTFELTEDLIIEGSYSPQNVIRILDTNFKLEELRQAIIQDCLNNDGMVVPYKCSILRKHQKSINGRITAYMICKPNILVHTGSYWIQNDALYKFISETMRIWYLDEGVRDITIAAIINDLNESLIDTYWVNYMLDRVFIQPNVPGYLTSQQFSVENLAQIPLPSSPPETPNLSPIYPASLFQPADFDPFEKLSNDLIVLIGINMRLIDISRFCQTSKRFNRLICDNEVFWLNKIKLDFDQEKLKLKPARLSWKNYYRELAGLVQNELDFAQLDNDAMLAIRNLPPEAQLAAINELRRGAGLGEVRRRLNFEPDPEIMQIYNDVLLAYIGVEDIQPSPESMVMFFNLEIYANDRGLNIEEAFEQTFESLSQEIDDDRMLDIIQILYAMESLNNERYEEEIYDDDFIALFREAQMNPASRENLFNRILDISRENNRPPLWIYNKIPVEEDQLLRGAFEAYLV